tara:strand:+ start:189 stop:677 length:489 start_codon:yes stop_codon:yes gene_type:complete
MSLWKKFFGKPGPPDFLGPDQSTPDAFIRSYCNDYTLWNDYCNHLADDAKKSGAKTPFSECSQLYAKFLSPFIADDLKLQLVAFGSESSFDPSRLSMGNALNEGDLLKQTFFITLPHTSGKDEYYAELKPNLSGGFELRQIYYIDPFPEDYADGKDSILPCL